MTIRTPFCLTALAAFALSAGTAGAAEPVKCTNLDQGLYWHSVTMDHRTGKVELIGDSKKVHLTATPK